VVSEAMTLTAISLVILAHGTGTAAKADVQDAAKYIDVFRKSDLSAMDDAIATLAGMGPAVVPQLVKALAEPVPMVRSQVAAVVTKLGPVAKAAVPQLTKNLADADNDVRWNSANALGAIGAAAKSALPALEAMAAKDPLAPLQEAARDAIAKVKANK